MAVLSQKKWCHLWTWRSFILNTDHVEYFSPINFIGIISKRKRIRRDKLLKNHNKIFFSSILCSYILELNVVVWHSSVFLLLELHVWLSVQYKTWTKCDENINSFYSYKWNMNVSKCMIETSKKKKRM
jgi:hypothetical protein